MFKTKWSTEIMSLWQAAVKMRWLGFVLYILLTATTAQGTITCDAPPVPEGQTANVTCNFNLDVSKLKSYSITVEHYPPDSDNLDTVLDCTLVDKFHCKPKDGFVLSGDIDTHLRLIITQASAKNEGRFLCKFMSREEEPVKEETCDFRLVGATPTSVPTTSTPRVSNSTEGQTDNAGLIIGVTVGAVIVIAIVTIVIIVILVRRKRQQRPRVQGNRTLAPLVGDHEGATEPFIPIEHLANTLPSGSVQNNVENDTATHETSSLDRGAALHGQGGEGKDDDKEREGEGSISSTQTANSGDEPISSAVKDEADPTRGTEEEADPKEATRDAKPISSAVKDEADPTRGTEEEADPKEATRDAEPISSAVKDEADPTRGTEEEADPKEATRDADTTEGFKQRTAGMTRTGYDPSKGTLWH